MSGLSNAEMAAILDANYDAFAPAEAALLRLADAMADTPAYVSDELYAQLRQHYSEEQLIELATDAGLENLRARFNRVFDVGSDGLCSIMDHREAAAASSR
jgi:alkylhydroperoxidase family enzyme